MLKYEDKLYLSESGQQLLANYGSNTTSLEASKIIQRLTLNHFGFSSNDDSLKVYRTIYRTFSDDSEIMSSVFYMRENRCLYYTSHDLKLVTQCQMCH